MVHRDIKPHNLMLPAGRDEARREGARLRAGQGAEREGGREAPDRVRGGPGHAGLHRPGAGPGRGGCRHPGRRVLASAAPCTTCSPAARRSRATASTSVLAAHLQATAEPLDRVRPDVPAGLAAVVAKMMAKAPADRYPDAERGGGGAGPVLQAGRRRVVAHVPGRRSPAADGPRGAGRGAAGPIAWGGGRRLGPPPDPSGAAPAVGVAAVGVAGSPLLGLVGGLAGRGVQGEDPGGVLVVEVTEPGAEVLVDGERVTVTGRTAGRSRSGKPGTYKVEVRKDGFAAPGRR